MPEKKPDTGKMRIWNAVCKTNPSNTKEVRYGRKFTAIKPYSQFQAATEVFGPAGEGWGWHVPDFEIVGDGGEALVVCKVTLWWRDGTGKEREVPCVGAARLWDTKDNKPTKPDHDAHKKVLTDALTKGLSYLGFNADIFLGRWDDLKYVGEREAEEAESAKPAPQLLDAVTRRDLLARFEAFDKKHGVPDMCRDYGILAQATGAIPVMEKWEELWSLDNNGQEPTEDDWRGWGRAANGKEFWDRAIKRIADGTGATRQAAEAEVPPGEEF